MRLRKRCPALAPPLSRPTPCQHQSLEPSPYGGKSFPLHGCSRSRQRHDSQVAGTCGCPGVGGQVEENVPPGGVTRAVLLTRQGRLGQGTALAPTGHRPAYAPAAAAAAAVGGGPLPAVCPALLCPLVWGLSVGKRRTPDPGSACSRRTRRGPTGSLRCTAHTDHLEGEH